MSYDSERRELELEAARDVIAAKDTEIARLREALRHAEPWVEPGLKGSWRDGVMAEIAAALNGSPAPDPVAAMREQTLDECETIAQEHGVRNRYKPSETWRESMTVAEVYETGAIDVVSWIADAIGVLKRKGEHDVK